MYMDEYQRWLSYPLEDAALSRELAEIQGQEEQIKERFAVALKFGTAGLRGVLGAGSNRMNIYVVRQATQGLANWVKTQGGNQLVAISYDSRINSDVFAKEAARVLAANGIAVRIYDALMPVPALSFATRYYGANAGIMITASHNPAKYNGYKAYGPDGCQMTDDAAAVVYAEIQKTDILTAAMPYRAMINIINFIQAMDHVVPGFASYETLLYSPELKFYSNRVKMDTDFNTSLQGLHCLGDSSGWTRGLMMASVMGTLMGRKIAEEG